MPNTLRLRLRHRPVKAPQHIQRAVSFSFSACSHSDGPRKLAQLVLSPELCVLGSSSSRSNRQKVHNAGFKRAILAGTLGISSSVLAHRAPNVPATPSAQITAQRLQAAPAAQLPRTALEDRTPEEQARAEVTRRIKELGRKGKPKQAINELTNLAKMGIQPDTISATALVSACVANRNMDMAMNVFDELFGALLPAPPAPRTPWRPACAAPRTPQSPVLVVFARPHAPRCDLLPGPPRRGSHRRSARLQWTLSGPTTSSLRCSSAASARWRIRQTGQRWLSCSRACAGTLACP